MRLHSARLAAAAILCAVAGEVRGVTNVFEYPLVHRRHLQLTADFQRAIRQRNVEEAGRACRAGAALLPENAAWRYNLACVLAVQQQTNSALESLGQAVRLGFHDASLIARDPDLAVLRPLPAFQELLQRARDLQGKPGEGQPTPVPAPVMDGLVRIGATNTIWDLDRGHFRAFFAFPSNAPPPSAFAERWNGPAAALVRPWLSAGTAAGNFGDCYDNRDDGHARLDCAPFAGLTAIQYDADARRHGAHYGLDSFLHNAVVFGNSSLAVTAGPLWRSLPRGAVTEGPATIFLFAQYLNNHIYCYPAHHDYDPAGAGDLFPVNQPYILISQGSSGSDQPFLRAVAATLAAFQPETKRWLVAHNLVAPTVQMVLRASRKGITRPEDLFEGPAHPAAFDAASLDVERMVRLAHELTTNDIPPVVALRTLADTRAVPGVDFFDAVPQEALYDTPCVIGRVFRTTARHRSLTVGASLMGAPTDRWQIRWAVLSGDPRKVSIVPRKPDQSLAEIDVIHHGGRFPAREGQPLLTSRVDVGVFACRGDRCSAPSFISFFHLNNEIRSYADDGRLLSVDYAAAATNRYVDPLLSLAKHWRDEYQYDADGHLTGWTRRTGSQVERFNARGERVEETDARGRPLVTRTVNYITRSAANNATAPDLVQVDGEVRLRYRYASDQDLTGEVASRERAGP
jgi:YD repeat-containing protein